MPARAPIASAFLRAAALLLLTAPAALAYEAPAAPAPRPLVYPQDTYAFKNETVWNYGGGTVQNGPDTAKKQRQYTRRCFVLCRSTLQFWKFAAFDPSLRPLGDDAMARRIREVCARPVWYPILPAGSRIVIPGYHNLREASAARPDMFRANVGNGWSIYFRPGNFPITLPVDRSTEARVNEEIWHDLQMNYPTIIWSYRFPSLKLNHVLLIFAGARDGRGYHYLVYDPNYSDRPGRLEYDSATRSFSYQPTYYFKGGYVNVRAIYRGLFQ
jgi:hypothetical protein